MEHIPTSILEQLNEAKTIEELKLALMIVLREIDIAIAEVAQKEGDNRK